jgi:hypothetical protein
VDRRRSALGRQAVASTDEHVSQAADRPTGVEAIEHVAAPRIEHDEVSYELAASVRFRATCVIQASCGSRVIPAISTARVMS